MMYRKEPVVRKPVIRQISMFDIMKADIEPGTCVGPESCGRELRFQDAYGMQHQDVIVQNPYQPEVLRVMRIHQPVRKKARKEPCGLVFAYGNTITGVYGKEVFDPDRENRFRMWAVA